MPADPVPQPTPAPDPRPASMLRQVDFDTEPETKPLAAFGGLIAAERDDLRAEVARLTAELEQATAALTELAPYSLGEQLRATEAKLALQQPVIDAAKAWRETFAADILEYAAFELPVVRALIAAVDALSSQPANPGDTQTEEQG